MALALLCSTHPSGLLLCTQSGSGCAQWVSLLLSPLSPPSILPVHVNILKKKPKKTPLCALESLRKSERRPGHEESSRSCGSVSSWMKTCTATWSGSLMPRSWMPTEKGKVSTVRPPQQPVCAETMLSSCCRSPFRTPAFNEWRLRHRQSI